MAENEDRMDKRHPDETAGADSPSDSIEYLREQLNDVEQVLHQTEKRSLNLIEILKQSRSDFFAIFDSVPAVIWYRNADGKILRANQAAADSVGGCVRELIGKNYYDIISDGAAESRRQDTEVIISGQPQRGLLRQCRRRDGIARWMTEDRFPLRNKKGSVIGVMVFAQDVTEKKEAEERLLQAKKEIEIRNEQLKVAAAQSEKLAEQASRSNLAKSEILASSSHDLRTPMNAIIGFSELLLDTEMDDEQREYVHTIHKSSTSLLSLINDILDFTKLEVGKLNIQIVTCELSAFVEDIRSMMQPGAVQKGLTFEMQIDPRLPESFFTDPIRLRQCLVNLIGNAVKFTTDGTVRLHVRPERRKARPCIRFDVEDSGIGISEEQQRRIFDSYSQADASTERMYGGTGLGLAITRKLVDLLGGHITVMSEPGKGSIFSIVLPLVDAAAPQLVHPEAEAQMTQTDDARKICHGRILVGENNLPGQLTMNLLLRRVGLSVDIASSPEQLFDKAAAEEYDILILDLVVDNDSVLDIVRKLRRIKKYTPIVAIGPCSLELMKSMLGAGCSKYLSKPVSRQQLYDTIFELMQQAAFEKQLRSIASGRRDGLIPETQPEPEADDETEDLAETFEPEELVNLLQMLIQQLPDAANEAGMDQIAEVIEVLGKVSVFCDKPEYRRQIDAIKASFQANLGNEQQRRQMLADLEKICAEIHRACEAGTD